MIQIEGQLRHGRVAPGRLDLQTAQHDFLQRGRIVGPQAARRHRVAPEPAPHSRAGVSAFAERPHAGGEKIQQEERQRELVAARIVADRREQLLGRHIGSRAERQPEFLLHQVGKLGVMRKAKIKQHGFAVRPYRDVARLDVEMDDMLPMQIVQSGRDFHADVGDLGIRQRQLVEPLI